MEQTQKKAPQHTTTPRACVSPYYKNQHQRQTYEAILLPCNQNTVNHLICSKELKCFNQSAINRDKEEGRWDRAAM